MSRTDVDTPDFVDSNTAADRIDPVEAMQWAAAVAVGAAWVGALTWLGFKALAWVTGALA